METNSNDHFQLGAGSKSGKLSDEPEVKELSNVNPISYRSELFPKHKNLLSITKQSITTVSELSQLIKLLGEPELIISHADGEILIFLEVLDSKLPFLLTVGMETDNAKKAIENIRNWSRLVFNAGNPKDFDPLLRTSVEKSIYYQYLQSV